MTSLETAIKSVTVFTDRARITREGKISLEPGNHRIEFSGLPTTLEQQSVRVSARGTAKAKIQGVDVNKVFFKDIPPGKALELTEQIQALDDRDRELSDLADSILAKIKHLDGLADATRTYAVSLAKGKTTIEAHAALLEFITTGRSDAQTQIRENAIQRRDVAKERKQLEKQLNQINKQRPKERYNAVVEIEILQAGELEIQLSYMFFGAGWRPLYDIRLKETALEIGYLAEVNQKSGEDWDNISLTLSTARPSTATAVVPELVPWYISPYLPPPPPPMQPAVAMAGAIPKRKAGFAQMAAAEPEMEMLEELDVLEIEEAEYDMAEVSQSGAFVTYFVGDGIDIPGNGSHRKNTIAQFKLTPEQDYVIAPKLEELAYRRVRAQNDSAYLLLPGTAQLFDGDDYIGSVPLKLNTPGEKLKLYFGTDDRIRVKRELVNRETEKKFMADKRRIRFAYKIKLENHTGESQKISLKDQLPVTRHETIKVKLEDSEPEVTKIDELNRLKWLLNLKDGEKQIIRFDFAVEYPRDMKVVGLS
ncbi:MAG: mucoidy inhibitor MuiA family protein [bacterium]|nr:mucoidy inhibitor MuiA family protein [bacterium]